jgi:hypothetical protein
MKVALYARVSTTDQGQNPETQLYRLRQIAQARGYEIFKEYTDDAQGKNPDRPAFKALMLDARAHEFDLILVTRLDRMMRSTKNLFNVLEELEGYKVEFQCTEQDIGTTGAMGRFMLTLLSGLAKRRPHAVQERRDRSLRIHDAQPRHVVVGGEVLSGDAAAQLLAAPREQSSDDLHVRSQALQRRGDDGWIVLAVDHDDGARHVPYRPSS